MNYNVVRMSMFRLHGATFVKYWSCHVECGSCWENSRASWSVTGLGNATKNPKNKSFAK